MNENNTRTGDLRHAKVTLAKPTVHAKHPFKDPQNHKELLEYLQQRLLVGKESRDMELPRLVSIDKTVAGWMMLSAEDKARKLKQEQTGDPLMTNVTLPLSFIHLDDMMTYYSQTFAPNRGMFYHTGRPGEVAESDQIVTKMNNDALYFGYFREVLRGMWTLLKYNTGGYHVIWSSDSGPKITQTPDGSAFDTEVKWSGNRLEAIDRYNFMCDPSVEPAKLHTEGEFAAMAKVRSHFWLQKRASEGVYFNCDRALKNHDMTGENAKYYVNPPREANFVSGVSNGTDWKSVLSETPTNMVGGHEIVTIYIRLNPTEFGLIEGDAKAQAAHSRYEIWRFDVLNDEFIILAEPQNNIHGHIPTYLGMIHDDAMGTSQKSVAELLKPLQDFASALLNLHVAANRKVIWGTTFFDPTVVDYDAIPAGEVAARVPIKPAGYGQDINKSVFHDSANIDTKQTMQDVEAIMNIIGQFFPTQALPSQIASIDRAVTDQVAAVQQGANRRQQKTARLIDDSIFRNVRYAMYYNILQYQPDDASITDFYTGKQVELNLSKLKDTNLPFIIGQGLKAIDRTAAASMLQNIIFALIQAPQAAQGINLLALIDYWTSMIDIDIDMTQFHVQQPAAAPGAEGQAAETDAAGNPIQPATNPENVTAPIFG